MIRVLIFAAIFLATSAAPALARTRVYYTTQYAGGAVLQTVTPDGKHFRTKPIYSFCPTQFCSDGANPTGNLLLRGDGSLLGETENGGNYSSGLIFRLVPDGSSWRLETLKQFCDALYCRDGGRPMGGLVAEGHGLVIGVTTIGGSLGGGTLFRYWAQGEGAHGYSVIANFR